MKHKIIFAYKNTLFCKYALTNTRKCAKLEQTNRFEGILYNTDGDALEQRNITIYLNASEPIRLTVSGTDGKNESRRFKMYLDQNPTMYFEGEGLIAFKFYKLN